MMATDPSLISPRECLPHQEPMILIDRVVALGEDYLESEVVVRADTLFVRGGAVPAWVGVEYMAQTCAVFAGFEARGLGEPVRVGFLLGSRDYRATVAAFEVGSVLRVRVARVHRERGGLCVAECRIHHAESETPLVQATLTLCEVPDLEAYLSQRGGAS
jgi:predicted hotdog family 3-hydroxylacyl-ACP dehydratase